MALPLKLGQSIHINETKSSKSFFSWRATYQNNHWFTAELSKKDFSVIKSNDKKIAERLNNLLCSAREINPAFLIDRKSYQIVSNLEFHKDWGFGSSSALVSNVAYWAEIDPFVLLQNTFGGSGYDVACARSDKPIVYQLIDHHRMFNPVPFNPPFNDCIYFIWLGKKQNSSDEIKRFFKINGSWIKEVEAVSEITDEMINCNNISHFQNLVVEHEKIISGIIKTKPIKEKLFDDFNGEIKSLGAWGGDFVMAVSDMGNEKLIHYFKQKGFDVLFPYKDLVL